MVFLIKKITNLITSFWEQIDAFLVFFIYIFITDSITVTKIRKLLLFKLFQNLNIFFSAAF